MTGTERHAVKRARAELGSRQRPRKASELTTCVTCRGTAFYTLRVDVRTRPVDPVERRRLTVCEICSTQYDLGDAS